MEKQSIRQLRRQAGLDPFGGIRPPKLNIHNKINCKTLFATHYHELTKLSKTLKKLSLFSLEAKEFNEEIIFLYIFGCYHRCISEFYSRLFFI